MVYSNVNGNHYSVNSWDNGSWSRVMVMVMGYGMVIVMIFGNIMILGNGIWNGNGNGNDTKMIPGISPLSHGISWGILG